MAESFSGEHFSHLEEVGFRLRALRESRGLSKAQVRGSAITHVGYTRVEEGRGSWPMVLRVMGLLRCSLDITMDGRSVPCTDRGPRDAIMDFTKRRSLGPGEVARQVGLAPTSVRVFESSQNPQVFSMARYAAALGVSIDLVLRDAQGDPVVPERILAKSPLRNLDRDYRQALEPEPESGGLGADLAKLREKSGLSKAEVARRAGVTAASVARVEKDATRLDTAAKVATALGKTLTITVDKKDVAPADVARTLDGIRRTQGITITSLANSMGTTYRTVEIFPDLQPSPANLHRYARALGLTLHHRLS